MRQKSIGLYLKELRVAKGLTQKDLAEKIAVPNRTVWKWECGIDCPEYTTLPLLAEALETSVEELLQHVESKSDKNFTNEKPTGKKLSILKAERGKVFFVASAILSTAFFFMLMIINTVLNLNSGLSGVLDILQPLTIVWLATTGIIGFIPWLFFYLVDKYRLAVN